MKTSYKLCPLHTVAYILVIVGALNWWLVALSWYTDTNINLVNFLFGRWKMLELTVYLLVGISGIALLFRSSCGLCDKENSI